MSSAGQPTYGMLSSDDETIHGSGIKMPSPNTCRLLLSELRGGDYAHAGDQEAIERIVSKALSFDPTLQASPTLDVGCGFGGTVNALHTQGFLHIQGCDLDPAAIAYAQNHYPSFAFKVVDALTAAQYYPADHFGLITLFNVSYAIQDKNNLLKALSAIAKPGAILAIFDYTCGEGNSTLSISDFAGKPMHLLHLKHLSQDLEDSQWEFLENVDMTADYQRWYTSFLEKLDAQETSLKTQFSVEDIQKVKTTFEYLLKKIEEGTLGGGAVYARKRTLR
jgi:SAM-dependent methyltransferase